jgi:hypothetical protein
MATQLAVSTDIDAPIDIVWARVTDIEHAADTIEAIKQIEMLSEPPHAPIRPGTKWRETRLMMGKEATEEMWVTSVLPPEEGEQGSATYHVGAFSHGTRYLSEIRLTTNPQGGTTLTYAFSGKAETLGAKILSPLGSLMKGAIRKCFEADLADIKRACERVEAPAGAQA